MHLKLKAEWECCVLVGRKFVRVVIKSIQMLFKLNDVVKCAAATARDCANA